MRLLSILFSCFLALNLQAQCDGDRYFNQIFNDFTEEENIVYGTNLDLNGAEVSLLLDVYQPVGDTQTDRPLIIMVHGGSFIGGSKDEIDIVPLAEDFTKMGYVVASINYRLGIPIVFPIEQPAQEAVMRGVQDGKAAVRWFRKDVAENGNTYNINPDEIYMLGSSAGGFVALHTAYLDQESELPPLVDPTNPGLGGGIEGESGNAGYSSEVKAIVNIAGAIGDWQWMEEGDIPVCSFHGTGDTVVPFDTQILQFFQAVDVTLVHGSSTIAEKADSLGIVNCFEIYEQQGHVPHVDNAAYYDTTRSIASNFLGSMVCPSIPLDCEYREITLSQEEETLESSFNFYPNPANENITIELPKQSRGNIRVLDMQGRVVWEENVQHPVFQIGTTDWQNGTYVIEWTENERIYSKQLILLH